MKKFLFVLALIVLLIPVDFTGFKAQDNQQGRYLPGINPEVSFVPDFSVMPGNRSQFISQINKSPGQYTRTDWQALIDAYWGAGLPTADKLAIFDNFWNTIDQKFACFHNHDIDWTALKNQYRPEVTAGVSRGRFQAIMNYMSIALRESHTNASDNLISSTVITPGVPLLCLHEGFSGKFGAGLTMLPDSSLLVYDVIPNHPLGLELGDIVLGYDGVPWKILVFQLIDYQLPIKGRWGSSPSAFIHLLLTSAGRNWHLFDIIDIVKYDTKDTVHLSTAPLQNQEINLYVSEQVEIPGISKPDTLNGIQVTYGIYPGTNIGYVYGAKWTGLSKEQFFNAIHNLLNTDGIIIDFRTNFGGGMTQPDSGLALLFSDSVIYTDWASRCNSRKHTLMCPGGASSAYIIPGNPPGYDKPIAVLTGPGAVSAGDQVSLRLKQHPRVRIFGKSTNGAFNGPYTLNLHPDWLFRYAFIDFYELKNPGVYLTHTELSVDENVWLTPSIVAQGKDDVVEAALNWINSMNLPTVTVFEDGAESGFGNWTTNVSWGTISQYPKSGIKSFTDSPSGNYLNKTNNSMTLANALNTVAYSDLKLSFWHRYVTQSGKDFCLIEISTNKGVSWIQLANYSGTLSTMTQVEFDINNYKSAGMKIRFRLTSDKSIVADGWYVDDIKITGKSTGKNIADNIGNNDPKNYSLGQNYPNPFNPVTTIKYDIPKENYVTLKIFDILGREVATLVNGKLKAGSYIVNWNASTLPSGIYFYRITTGDFSDVKRMILIK